MDTDILQTTFLYSFQNDISTVFTTCIYAGPVAWSGFSWVLFAHDHILSVNGGITFYNTWLCGSGKNI